MSRARARQKKKDIAKSQIAKGHGQNPMTNHPRNATNGTRKGKGRGKASKSQAHSTAPGGSVSPAVESLGVIQSQPNTGSLLSLGRTPSASARLLQTREAISILFMLTDCPKTAAPSDTVRTPQPDSAVSIVPAVSLALETHIVEDFTFLSSTTTDSSKVRALCLERYESHCDRFLLKIACNHGELETVKMGLKGIIGQLKDDLTEHDRTMAVPTTGPRRTTKSRLDTLLQSIVALNFNRILCRLQSKHAIWQGNFKKCKAARAPILPRFFDVLRDTRLDQVMVGQVASAFQTLKVLFRSFEDEQTAVITSGASNAIASLSNIVKCIYCLWRVPDCCAAISSPGLLRQISKIARYVTVMFSLLEHRRHYPWVGLLEVESVRLDPVILPPVCRGLEESARELSVPSETVPKLPQKVRRITEHVGKTPNETFADLVNAKCAVHAEIQLLFHYELRGRSELPRVILSTKAPCFLCALFFVLHGRYRAPESHGRLYEKWTLPDTVQKLPRSNARQMNDVMERFVVALSERIGQAVSKSQVGRLASCESLFRKSAIWPRFSRAPSLVHIVESSWPATQRHQGRPGVRNTVLRQLWCSTTMLVTSNKSVSKLGRGRHVAFQLNGCPADQTAIRTDHLHLVFSTDSDHNMNLDWDEARPKTVQPLLVKIGRPEVGWERARPSITVDVSTLEPGGEVVIVGREPFTCTNFVVRHKDDYVQVQVQSACPIAIDQ